jgi:hypothetical protein
VLVRGIDPSGREVVLNVPQSEVGKVLLQITGEWATLANVHGERWQARDLGCGLELRPLDPRRSSV